jgi:hypothetical protein
MDLLGLIGRIIASGTITSTSLLWDWVQHGKTSTEFLIYIVGENRFILLRKAAARRNTKYE